MGRLGLIGVLSAMLAVASASMASAAIGDCNSGSGAGAFPAGEGSVVDPYIVTTSAQLVAIGTTDCRDENYRQGGDIALSGTWTPIGDFVGSYDGGRHSITELQLSGSNAGLFNVGASGATFSRLSISVTTSASTGSNIGALVGLSSGPLSITDVHVRGDVISRGCCGSSVGGLVGNAGSTVNVSGSSVTGNVSAASSYVGGVVGKSTGGVTVSSTVVESNVTSTAGHASGGLVGESGSTVLVSGSLVTGDVSGAGSYAGGAVGHAGGAVTVTAMSFVGTVTSTGAGEVGGLVGRGESTVNVSGSSVTGDVTAAGNHAGGVVGTALGEVTIGTTAVAGDVLLTVGGWVGGLVAVVSSLAATDSFYYGTVITPNPSAGGIAGKVHGNITLSRVYVAGSRPSPPVTNQSGFVPEVGGTLSTNLSFCTGADCGAGSRVNDSQLKSASFLRDAGWDLDTVWCVSSSTNDGYPVLRAITFPAAGFAPCWTPVVAVTPIWRVALDPNGGECREGKTIRNEKWQSVFAGYRYLPGKDDCERDGFTFEGWADAGRPDELLNLPVLVDPMDGVKRAFLASNAELVAVWKEVDVDLDDLTGTAPGAFVGGVDRPTREGGGVVDGYYIPPRTVFGPWMLAK